MNTAPMFNLRHIMLSEPYVETVRVEHRPDFGYPDRRAVQLDEDNAFIIKHGQPILNVGDKVSYGSVRTMLSSKGIKGRITTRSENREPYVYVYEVELVVKRIRRASTLKPIDEASVLPLPPNEEKIII